MGKNRGGSDEKVSFEGGKWKTLGEKCIIVNFQSEPPPSFRRSDPFELQIFRLYRFFDKTQPFSRGDSCFKNESGLLRHRWLTALSEIAPQRWPKLPALLWWCRTAVTFVISLHWPALLVRNFESMDEIVLFDTIHRKLDRFLENSRDRFCAIFQWSFLILWNFRVAERSSLLLNDQTCHLLNVGPIIYSLAIFYSHQTIDLNVGCAVMRSNLIKFSSQKTSQKENFTLIKFNVLKNYELQYNFFV